MFDHLNKNLFYPNFYKRFLFKLCKIISIFLSKNMYMIQDKHTYSFDDSLLLLVNSYTTSLMKQCQPKLVVKTEKDVILGMERTVIPTETIFKS